MNRDRDSLAIREVCDGDFESIAPNGAITPGYSGVIPSVRSRFVTRARWLLHNREFQQAITDLIRQWNEKYPHLAIASPPAGQPSTVIASRPFLGYVLPPPMDAMYPRDYGTEPVPYMIRADIVGGENWPEWEWAKLIQHACIEWWPPEYYPNWYGSDGTTGHPALLFVSACLVWTPRRLAKIMENSPNELISDHPVLVRRTVNDPTGAVLNDDPNEVYWQTRYSALTAAMRAALACGETLNADLLDSIEEDAEEVASEAQIAAVTQWISTEYLILHLYPGITTTDLKELAKIGVPLANRECDLPSIAKRIFAETKNIIGIARLLGVSERTVRGYLSE